jgi:hypothetical protein
MGPVLQNFTEKRAPEMQHGACFTKLYREMSAGDATWGEFYKTLQST